MVVGGNRFNFGLYIRYIMKIIIDNKSTTCDASALNMVQKVIQQGKISEDKGEPCYSWLTTFRGLDADYVVAYIRNKGSDRFIVYNDI